MTARFKVAIQIRLRHLPGTGCNGALLVRVNQEDKVARCWDAILSRRRTGQRSKKLRRQPGLPEVANCVLAYASIASIVSRPEEGAQLEMAPSTPIFGKRSACGAKPALLILASRMKASPDPHLCFPGTATLNRRRYRRPFIQFA